MTAYGRVTVWDVETRALRYRPSLPGGASVGIGFSPDGTVLATAGSWMAWSSWTRRPEPVEACLTGSG